MVPCGGEPPLIAEEREERNCTRKQDIGNGSDLRWLHAPRQRLASAVAFSCQETRNRSPREPEPPTCNLLCLTCNLARMLRLVLLICSVLLTMTFPASASDADRRLCFSRDEAVWVSNRQ